MSPERTKETSDIDRGKRVIGRRVLGRLGPSGGVYTCGYMSVCAPVASGGHVPRVASAWPQWMPLPCSWAKSGFVHLNIDPC